MTIYTKLGNYVKPLALKRLLSPLSTLCSVSNFKNPFSDRFGIKLFGMHMLILSVSMVQLIAITVTRMIIRNLRGVLYWQRRIRSIIGSLFGPRLNGLISFLPGRQGFFCSILTGKLSSRHIAYKLLNFFKQLLSTLL